MDANIEVTAVNWLADNWILVAALGLAAAAGWWGIHIFLSKLRSALMTRDLQFGGGKDPRVHTLLVAAKRSLFTLLLLVVAVLFFTKLGFDLSAVWGAAGVAGIALGLATQGIAKDGVRGMSLLLSDELHEGEKVGIAGTVGVVEEVRVRRITLRDDNGAVHFIPCGAIGTVTNYSRGYSYAVLEIRIARDADLNRAIQAVRDVAEELRADHDYAAKILGPIEDLGFDRWTDWSMVIKAKVKVTAGSDGGVRRELFHRILDRFERDGIGPHYSMLEDGRRSGAEPAQQ